MIWFPPQKKNILFYKFEWKEEEDSLLDIFRKIYNRKKKQRKKFNEKMK